MTMNRNTGLFLRFMAVLVVIFVGITALWPQSTAPENESNLPVWTDMTASNTDYVRTVYKNGLMDVAGGEAFGVDMPFTAHEAAYVSAGLYEALNGIEKTFTEYDKTAGPSYVEKAVSYGIWSEDLPVDDVVLSREKMAYIISPFVTETAQGGLDEKSLRTTYKDTKTVLNLYNLGIACATRPSAAFSPVIDATRGDAAMLYAMVIDKALRLKPEVKDYAPLQTQLETVMSQWSGDWSLYFEDYDTGQSISVNSHQVYSASLIKLFVTEAVYDGIKNGTISDNNAVNDAVRKMITYSDNESWSYLARVLGGGVYSRGMAKTTELAQANGHTDTGTFYKGTHRNFNFTSVNDCGAFLGRVLDGSVVSREYSQKLLDLLKEQQIIYKVPSGIPDNVMTANKTGELDYMQGDAAIVYGPSGTYILVIIGDSLTNSYGQTAKFTELSEIVYNYMNPTDNQGKGHK